MYDNLLVGEEEKMVGFFLGGGYEFEQSQPISII